MAIELGHRATRVLTQWGSVAAEHPTGRNYTLERPTRSEIYLDRLAAFIEEPTESTFNAVWTKDSIAAATGWEPTVVLNLWAGTIDDLAGFLDDIRSSDEYDPEWEERAPWGSIIAELFTRARPDRPILSNESRKALRKLGITPDSGFDQRIRQMEEVSECYLDIAGHVTAQTDEPIPVYEEMDQLFRLITTVQPGDITAELDGPRRELYDSLKGFHSTKTDDSGPIEIDFTAARPAIEGHILARQNDAYADEETEHWAGTHYESWKWDFAEYLHDEVLGTYDLESLSATELPDFFDDFWGHPRRYTELSTPVPAYLLGRWGVVQLGDFKALCLQNPEGAADVISDLLDRDEHLVDRLTRFHDFAVCDEVTDGNLLRIATSFLMGVYPDEYINFQYERFNTFFSDCSGVDSLTKGFDARQYYRILLACGDIRDAMRPDLPEASMLDVHTVIRLYQDSVA